MQWPQSVLLRREENWDTAEEQSVDDGLAAWGEARGLDAKGGVSRVQKRP